MITGKRFDEPAQINVKNTYYLKIANGSVVEAEYRHSDAKHDFMRVELCAHGVGGWHFKSIPQSELLLQ